MKSKNKKKFSDLINDFTNLWLEWMQEYKISIDETKSFKIRRKGGERCEELIKMRYENINLINEFFIKK